MNATPSSSSRRYFALVLATLAFALCFSVWSLVSPLAPQFRELYHLSAGEAGLLVAVPVLLGSLARIPMGLLTDRYGGRVTFTALMIFLLIPVTIIGFVSSYGALLFWSFWLGMAGASFAIGVPFVARWFPPTSQGLALGIYGMGNIGTAISSFLAPRLAAEYGWPIAFWVFLPFLIAMAALFWLAGHDAPGFSPRSQSLTERLSLLRHNHLTWAFSFFYFITFGGFVAISIYLPTYLVQVFGLDKVDAGTRAAVFVVVATLARPFGGSLADRLGGSKVLTAALLTVVILAAVLAFGPGIVLATVVFLTMALALGLGNGAVFKLVAQYFASEAGTVTGLVGAAGGLGGFFPPLIMGTIHDATGSYAIGFFLLSLFALVALAVSFRLFRGNSQIARRTAEGRRPGDW